MFIVALEGIDASGKATQTAKISEYLSKQGYKVLEGGFPRYYQPIGELIGSWLRGEVILSDESAHMLYDADRLDYQRIINQAEKLGYDFIILDRYLLSNLAFGMARGHELDWMLSLQTKVKQPDLTFVLDVTTQTSFQRRGERRDLYELDDSMLNRARTAYHVLANKFSKDNDELIYTIDCNHVTSEEVHEVIVSHVEGLLLNK